MADELKIPFDQYAADAYNRKAKLGTEVAMKADKASRHLYGKAGAMGENVGFYDSKISKEVGDTGVQALKNADQAYDKTQNLKESEMEDLQKRFELNAAANNKKK